VLTRRRGPWAVLLRRRQEPLPVPSPDESAERAPDGGDETQPTAASGDSSLAPT
jgi:hypothetical protein